MNENVELTSSELDQLARMLLEHGYKLDWPDRSTFETYQLFSSEPCATRVLLTYWLNSEYDVLEPLLNLSFGLPRDTEMVRRVGYDS